MIKLTQEQVDYNINIKCKELNISVHKPVIYKNVETKLCFKCNNCKNVWDISYHHLMYGGTKCVICNCIKTTKKLTFEQIIKNINIKNNKIEILDKEYINTKTKMSCRCSKCGNEFIASYSDIMNSSKINGCVKCEKKKNTPKKCKSTDEYKKDVFNVHKDNIIVLGEYTKSYNKIKVKCNTCEHEWETEATAILKGYGCSKCGHEKNRKSTVKNITWLKEKIFDVHGDRIEIIDGVYYNINSVFKMKCNICEHEWSVTANSLKTRGCPCCNISKGELKIKKYLDILNIKYIQQYIITQKTPKGGTTSFDFFIEDLNTAIEYDGKQHFEPIKYWGGLKKFNDQKETDIFKKDYCIKNGIRLIRIPYYEFDNINEENLKNKIYDKKQ